MNQTPLFPEYAAHGARVVDFHGWSLPVQFEGIVAEHHHTRTGAGLFDCSHMTQYRLSGLDSIQAFDRLVFSDMVSLRPGRCRYSAILDDTGHVLDDFVALRLDADTLFVVANAGPYDKVRAVLAERVPGVCDVSGATAKLDVQGPLSRRVLIELGFDEVVPLAFWSGIQTQYHDREIIIMRAGYTGELGYELYVPAELARPLWRTLMGHPEVRPCGLGARDTLRLEAGLPLYGEDVTDANTPLEAGMGRFVRWDKSFEAKEALLAQRETGNYPVLTALQSMSRQAPRKGFELRHEGAPVGRVTSGTFGPSVGCGVGFAYLPAALTAPGTPLTAGPRDLKLATAAAPVYKDGTSRLKVEP